MKKASVLISVLVLASVVMAAVSEPHAEADTKVNENEPTTNYGADESFTIWGGSLMPPTPAEMGLLYFQEMEELRQAGAVIDFAVLKLYITTMIQSGDAKIYRAAGPWDEMAVTWDTRPDSNLDIVAVNGLPPNKDIWFETEVTGMVKSWVEDGFPNNGFYVTVPEQSNTVGCLFASINHSDSAIWPRLFMEYHTGAVLEKGTDTGVELQVSSLSSGTTRINYTLISPSTTSLKVYDASGALLETLVDGTCAAGRHQSTWSPETPGVYFVRLVTPEFTSTQKLVLVK